MYENASFAGTITVHGSQKEARNIERAIYKSQRNINSVKPARNNSSEPPNMPKGKTNLKDQEETKSVPLENAVTDRKVIIGGNLSKAEEIELRNFSQEQRRLRLVSLQPERSQQGYYTTLPSHQLHNVAK